MRIHYPTCPEDVVDRLEGISPDINLALGDAIYRSAVGAIPFESTFNAYIACRSHCLQTIFQSHGVIASTSQRRVLTRSITLLTTGPCSMAPSMLPYLVFWPDADVPPQYWVSDPTALLAVLILAHRPNATTTFRSFTPEQLAFADELISYWTSFVRDGDPNSSKRDGSPEWDACAQAQSIPRMVFKGTGSAMELVSKEERGRHDYWLQLANVLQN